MGKKDKSKSSSVSGSAQAWAQPYATAGAGSVQSVFNDNQGGLNQLTNLAQNSVVPAVMDKFNAGLGAAGQGRDYYSDVLSGKYRDGNPYLDAVIGKARGGVSDAVNSNFAMAGRYGSGAHTGVLADKLGEMESGMRFANYGNEMNRMDSAAGAAQGANSNDLSQLLASLGVSAELPYTGSSNLASSLGALFGGGTSNSSQTQGWLSPVLGAVGSVGSALAMSARELKTDIRRVGSLPDGLGVYDFTYKIGGPRHRGVMADEVAELRPWALGPAVNGFASVDYAKL